MTSLADALSSLKVKRLPGDCGPYAEDTIESTEQEVGCEFSSEVRAFYLTVGGNLGFESGHVVVGDTARDVRRLYGPTGLGASVVAACGSYRGQIPQRWYPIGADFEGNLYCLDEVGNVWFIDLDEALWTRDVRPTAPPPRSTRIASDFNEFIRMLRLPKWARVP